MDPAVLHYLPVFEAIRNLSQADRPVIIAIDGRCGSGKTGLALLLQTHFLCNVFKMDDYYLPPECRSPNWTDLPAGNIDLSRFRHQVLSNISAGLPVPYQPYACQQGSMKELSWFSPCQLNIVEGSYCQHPDLASFYDLKLFLTCESNTQLTRLHAREGERLSAFLSRWIPMEELYLRSFPIQSECDLVVDTTTFF